jgi:membrane dipeptidase
MQKKTIFLEKHKAETDSLSKSGKSDFVAEGFLFSKYSDEVQQLRPPLSLLIQHIEYIIKLVGVDYVGLGSDFDGIEIPPLQLDDVTTYPLITKALLEKGYSKKDINKILGGNFLRVLKANEAK